MTDPGTAEASPAKDRGAALAAARAQAVRVVVGAETSFQVGIPEGSRAETVTPRTSLDARARRSLDILDAEE